jgi:hypothetical protein
MSATVDIVQVVVTIMGVGVAAQVLADRLRVPSVVFLIVAGVVVGPEGLGLVDPAIFGNALQAIVGLSVAIIVFEGAFHLHLDRIRSARRETLRLITVGALGSLVGTAVVVHARPRRRRRPRTPVRRRRCSGACRWASDRRRRRGRGDHRSSSRPPRCGSRTRESPRQGASRWRPRRPVPRNSASQFPSRTFRRYGTGPGHTPHSGTRRLLPRRARRSLLAPSRSHGGSCTPQVRGGRTTPLRSTRPGPPSSHRSRDR